MAWAVPIEAEMRIGRYVDRREQERLTLHAALERYLTEITKDKRSAPSEAYRIRAWQKRPITQRSLASLRGTDFAKYRRRALGRRRLAGDGAPRARLGWPSFRDLPEGMGHGVTAEPDPQHPAAAGKQSPRASPSTRRVRRDPGGDQEGLPEAMAGRSVRARYRDGATAKRAGPVALELDRSRGPHPHNPAGATRAGKQGRARQSSVVG